MPFHFSETLLSLMCIQIDILQIEATTLSLFLAASMAAQLFYFSLITPAGRALPPSLFPSRVRWMGCRGVMHGVGGACDKLKLVGRQWTCSCYPAATDEPDMFNWGGPFPILPPPYTPPPSHHSFGSTPPCHLNQNYDCRLGWGSDGGREQDPPTKQR